MGQFCQRLFPLLLLLILGACNRYHDDFSRQTAKLKWVGTPPPLKVVCEACPNEDERCLDRRVLGDQGERYTRRDEYHYDVSEFSPYPDEDYESYFSRMMNTLTLQEYNIEALKRDIESKKGSLDDLGAQLETMLQQEAEMRVALARVQNDPIAAAEMKKKGKQRRRRSLAAFDRYIVEDGDTLQKISMEAYGTYTAWLAIYRFNLKKMRYGPNQLEKGTVLFIPNVESL